MCCYLCPAQTEGRDATCTVIWQTYRIYPYQAAMCLVPSLCSSAHATQGGSKQALSRPAPEKDFFRSTQPSGWRVQASRPIIITLFLFTCKNLDIRSSSSPSCMLFRLPQIPWFSQGRDSHCLVYCLCWLSAGSSSHCRTKIVLSQQWNGLLPLTYSKCQSNADYPDIVSTYNNHTLYYLF